ncbi:MAG TPA: hypothetical protein VIN08_16000 [Ohtaekwangia sp.]|uniref:hypothetical protein n=1 Tax=Ohtaekwangia sp. TaxID=2066019 RepID=UPI002F93B35E
MKSLEIIEDVFTVSFPPLFKQFWRDFLEDWTCELKVYNHEEYYILNQCAIAELNTEKQEGVDLQSETRKLFQYIQGVPALKDFVPFAVSGLFHFYYTFLAFKRSGKAIEDVSVYRVYLFLDSEPEIINVKKLTNKYSDILGDEGHMHSIVYGQQPCPKGGKFVLRASDHLYSSLFEEYVFPTGYLDSVARQLNGLFKNFEGVRFSDEKLHTLYCESAGVKSVILKIEDGVAQSLESLDILESTRTIFTNLKSTLARELGEYTLYYYQWSFTGYDFPCFGLGLSKKNDLGSTLDRYGMLFNDRTSEIRTE